MIPPYRRGNSDIQEIKRTATVSLNWTNILFVNFFFTISFNLKLTYGSILLRNILFLLAKGLFYKGYMDCKTLFFSVLRQFHYLLTLVSITLKDFSCLVNVLDSFKLKHGGLIFHLWRPKGMYLKRQRPKPNLEKIFLMTLMLFFQIKSPHKNRLFDVTYFFLNQVHLTA